MLSPGKKLRELLRQPDALMIPGCLDVLSAKLFESMGFQAVWAGGFMSAASRLGLPDANIITLTEQVDFARHCALTVSVPVLVDADNGYGNAINVMRTVREFEQVGVAGIVIEDQVVPKRCGLYPGARPIVSVDEMLGKIHAATDARRDNDFVIVARTDSFGAGLSVDEALERAHAYVEAGADAIVPISKNFVNLERFGQNAKLPVPLIIAPTLFPKVTARQVKELGYSAQIQPLAASAAALWAMKECMEVWKRDGAPLAYVDRMLTFDQITQLIGIPELTAAEEKYLPSGSSLVEA